MGAGVRVLERSPDVVVRGALYTQRREERCAIICHGLRPPPVRLGSEATILVDFLFFYDQRTLFCLSTKYPRIVTTPRANSAASRRVPALSFLDGACKPILSSSSCRKLAALCEKPGSGLYLGPKFIFSFLVDRCVECCDDACGSADLSPPCTCNGGATCCGRYLLAHTTRLQQSNVREAGEYSAKSTLVQLTEQQPGTV